jgi:hypothetical protein
VIRVVIGIDPGKTGGVAILPVAWPEGEAEPAPVVFPLPYAPEDAQPAVSVLVDRVTRAYAEHVVVVVLALVEDVNSFGMGRQSAFVFGQGVGAILAACELSKWPARRVRPVKWQSAIGATRKGGLVDPLGPVSRMFPGVPLVVGRGRKPHMGIVDALGIAAYARSTLALAREAPHPAPFG